jgi:hypothetical protein
MQKTDGKYKKCKQSLHEILQESKIKLEQLYQ